MKAYITYPGGKSEVIDGYKISFECDPSDIDTAYSALAEGLSIDEKDLIEFEDVEDDSVKVMLDDMKDKDFISDWSSTNIKD